MCAGSWLGCLWSQMIHVVEKLRHVLIESRGEWVGFVEFEMYLLKGSFFAAVGFSKCRSYLNEREKCCGRHTHVIHVRW
jgi:hypothetical protein